jgi:hypothetical protein
MSSTEYIERWQRGEFADGKQSDELVQPDSQNEAFTMASHRCSKHGRALRYSDEQGGRYCDHVDCWARYRLIRSGAKDGYPTLSAVIDPRDYLPDLSKAPLYHRDGIAFYPTRPPICQQIIDAGPDAWRVYATKRDYQDIAQAIKAMQAIDRLIDLSHEAIKVSSRR